MSPNDAEVEPVTDNELSELEKAVKISEYKKQIAENEQALKKASINKEEEELNQQKQRAETQRAIAEAEQAVLAANFPKGESKTIEGKIETDEKFGYIAELVGYQSMQRCAQEIGILILNSLNLSSNSKILIVDTLSIAQDDFPLILLESQFTKFEDEFKFQELKFAEINPPKQGPQMEGGQTIAGIGIAASAITLSMIPSAAFGISAIASLMGDIVGYFKTDYNIKGRDIKLSDESLKASIASQLLAKHEVYLLNFNLLNESKLINRFCRLVMERMQLEALLINLRKSLDENSSQQGSQEKEEINVRKSVFSQVEQGWETLSNAFDTFAKAITSTTDLQQQPPLVLAALREQIRTMGISHLLFLKVTSSGGEAITEKKLFYSGRTAYIGGGAVSYVLVNTSGKVISSGTLVNVSQFDYTFGKMKKSKLQAIKMEIGDRSVE